MAAANTTPQEENPLSSKEEEETRTTVNGALQKEEETAERKRTFQINRSVYTQLEFDQTFEHDKRNSKTLKERLGELKSKCTCSGTCLKSVLYKIFPFLKIMKNYSIKDDFISDLASGLTVGVMHIPQGMAYGMLTNLPPVYGLYISFFPVLLYFLFGTSRHISIGTFAVVSLMVGTVVDKGNCIQRPTLDETTNITHLEAEIQNGSLLNDTDGGIKDGLTKEELACMVGWAMAVSFLAGLYQFLLGLFRLGFVTVYLSDPLTRAFTTGAAIYVVTSQIKHVFGIKTATYPGVFKIIYTYIEFFGSITTTNVASLIMSVIVMIIIYLVKEFVNPTVKKKIKVPVPIELIMIIIGTLVSYLGNFQERFNMVVVGEIPMGIPAPNPPPIERFSSVAFDAIGIAVVAFCVNVSMAKLFSSKHSYQMDANQEFCAYGVTNMVCSCLNCYCSAASLSRSLIQESVGGKTQVAGLVSCCLLLIVLFGVGPLFEHLPNNVLAAIVLVNLKGMFLQFKDLKYLWKISKYDMLIWIVTFVAVTVLTVDMGLFIGVGFSLLTTVFRTQRPYTCLLGRVMYTDIYKDLSVYDAAKEIPGIKIFRFEASLYYANCEHFTEKIFKKSEVNPRKLRAKQLKVENKIEKAKKEKEKEIEKFNNKRSQEDGGESSPMHTMEIQDRIDSYKVPVAPIKHIIVDCSCMTYIDAVGVDTLRQVIIEYRRVGIEVALAGCKAGIREMLETAGFFKKVEVERLYLSTHDAVLAAIDEFPDLKQQIIDDAQQVFNTSSIENLDNK